jgi:predicted transcriptional regulator
VNLKGIAVALILIFVFVYINQASIGSNVVVTPSEEPRDLSEEDVVYVLDWWEIPLKHHIVSYIAANASILVPLANLIAVLAAFLFGIRQIKKKNLLDNDKRAGIYREIQENPGINQTEIENITGINRSSLRHHLNFLEENGKVISQKVSKKRHYFENHNRFSPKDRIAISILDYRKTKDVLNYIGQNPGCTHKDLVGFTGLSGSAISWHISRLKLGNLINVEKVKNFSHYRVNADVKSLADQLAEESTEAYDN